jgi:hypothetical protein
MNPSERLALAKDQLARVQVASFDPVDWSDLSMYGLYCLENAVIATADHLSISWQRTHPSKVGVAQVLHERHGLPDVTDLLQELNELRKSEAYGEVHPSPDMEPEQVAIDLEYFVDAAARLIEGPT